MTVPTGEQMLKDVLELAVVEMEEAADKCDEWAEESKSGGWSTHQVLQNRGLADTLRRRAAHIRRFLRLSNHQPER